MNIFLKGLRHGEEGREGESQAEPPRLCDCKTARSSRRERKVMTWQLVIGAEILWGGWQEVQLSLHGLAGEG